MLPQLWYKSEVTPKGFYRTVHYRWRNMRTALVPRSAFAFEAVLGAAVSWGRVDSTKLRDIPDEDWWRKLCRALQDKHPQLSRYGSKLLHDRVVRSLANRLLFEQLYRDNKDEIERFIVREPMFVVGLPRCNGATAHHMLARSGLFLGMRQRDVMFPGFPAQGEREALARGVVKSLPKTLPHLQSVFNLQSDAPDSDLGLHLMCPRSLAWGMLHGLPEYLYSTLQEDQEHVFDLIHRVLRVFQWYRMCDEFTDCVKRHINEVLRPEIILSDGRKDEITRLPWVIHSPLALLHIDKLHKVFPDMKLVWCHRALSYCVASTCASLAIHNSVYTGVRPTQAQLSQVGEQVVGIFGSGAENAVNYLSKFPLERMVHWSDRDLARSGVRLVNKTIATFGLTTDRWRNHQTIDAATERVQCVFRPRLDSELAYFGLHDGIVGEHFKTYILQFEEYAFEPKFGSKIQDYVFMGSEYAKKRFMIRAQAPEGSRQTSFTELAAPGGMPLSDHQTTGAGGQYGAIQPHS
jgi:hypothetical protein